MAIADPEKTNPSPISGWATSRFLITGLLLYLACILPVWAQSRELDRAQRALDNGEYSTAIDLARKIADKHENGSLAYSAIDIIVASEIAQQRYDEAAATLERWFKILSKTRTDPSQATQVYLRASELSRAQRRYAEASANAKKAAETAPDNVDIQAGYCLLLGRIMFSSGYDLSAIIWLEKAEKLFESRPLSSGKLDTYRFLSLAWSSKLNYPAALRYSEKLVSAAAGSQFKHKYRQALFESATLLSSIGQKRKALVARETGLRLSLEQNNAYQARNFLSSLLLDSLHNGDIPKATDYLQQLRNLDTDEQFSFEIALGSAVVAGYTGQRDLSERLFRELEKRKYTSEFMLPSWRITVSEKNGDWEQVITHNRSLLELTLAQNFREDLPGIHLSFATAHFNLGQRKESNEHLNKALALIEEIRNSENRNLLLGLMEIYHKAYRLLAQTKLESPLEAFELSDYLKARLLKVKISNSETQVSSIIDPDTRRKLELLSGNLGDVRGADAEISKLEASFTTAITETVIPKPDFSELDDVPELENRAVVSYLFTLDKRLMAFVWEKGKPIRSVYLSGSENEIADDVRKTEQRIKNRIFFKRDGKQLFDRLLKPLNISATHLIIVPDKQLWKIPFQALSPDGEKYLIEDKVVSYAPSVAILIEQLKSPKPARLTLRAFANSSFNNQFLRNVNDESISVAGLFNSRPTLNATISDFRRLGSKSDILHFSMHAQADNEQPLDSFLAFKGIGNDDGRLTVAEILDSKLKKGSLVFLASCDTNNVFSGEGLVSLAWGMMGAGASTVISAQWEANDNSTKIFTDHFYKSYKRGMSSASAIQKASVELIKNKASNLHEPYYWAAFAISGDFR